GSGSICAEIPDRSLPGRQDFDLQGVDRSLQLIVKRIHHRAVLRYPAHTVKIAGRDSDTTMGFTTFPPAGATMVGRGVVDHLQLEGREFFSELGMDRVRHGHGLCLLSRARSN